MAGITTCEAANAYLREQFIPDYDAQFTRPPADPDPAFVPARHGVDLDLILCQEEERTVGHDNVVVLEGVALAARQAARPAHLRGLRVTVRRHLDGRHSVWRGPQCLGRYDATGRPLDGVHASPKTRPRTFASGATLAAAPLPALLPQPRAAAAALACRWAPGPERTDHLSKPSGHFTCQQHARAGAPCWLRFARRCRLLFDSIPKQSWFPSRSWMSKSRMPYG